LQTVHLSTGMRVDDWSDKETDDPVLADDRNFHKVEKWTLDGMKVDGLLYAASPPRALAHTRNPLFDVLALTARTSRIISASKAAAHRKFHA
jgi:hypothetical protein